MSDVSIFRKSDQQIQHPLLQRLRLLRLRRLDPTAVMSGRHSSALIELRRNRFRICREEWLCVGSLHQSPLGSSCLSSCDCEIREAREEARRIHRETRRELEEARRDIFRQGHDDMRQARSEMRQRGALAKIQSKANLTAGHISVRQLGVYSLAIGN